MDSPLKMIVVEDHDGLREVTVSTLCALGHDACGVNCGKALDDALGVFRPDLLILDLNLPGEDGLGIARRMRTARPDIGIIMVTVREQIHDRIAGYGDGADIYLTKPTSIEELDAAIKALSRRLRAGSPGVLDAAVQAHASKATEEDKMRALHDVLIGTQGKLPTLDELARTFGMSSRRLNEAFKKLYDSSIYAFVNAHRLNQAREAILNTDIPLKVIANQLGYAHVNHFNAQFRKMFGYPPGSLRRDREKHP